MKPEDKINLQEVLHYYMGSLFRFSYNKYKEVLVAKLEVVNDTGFMCGDAIMKNWEHKDNYFEINDWRTDGKMELILNSTYDMTKEQIKEYKSLCFKIVDLIDEKKVIRYADTPLSMHYLFKNSIDAFDLIETGQAIDKNSKLPLI